MPVVIIREPINSLTHLAGMLAAIPATLVLLRLCRGNRLKTIGMLIYGLSLILCYAGSGMFHAVPAQYSEEFATFDHIGIYALIAGTVTPIGLIVLRGKWRIGLVGGIWLLAVTGITVRLFCEPPLAVRTTFYLGMGWIGCSMYFQLAERLTHSKIAPIWIGGLFYTVGAAINLLAFPPYFAANLFTPHAVFHLFVIAGSACHYYFMVAVLVPYRGLPAFTVAVGRPALSSVAGLSNAGVRSGSILNAESNWYSR
jgi:hemolysin III